MEKEKSLLDPQGSPVPQHDAHPPQISDEVVEAIEQKGLFFLSNADPFVRKASLEILRIASDLSINLVSF